MSSLGFTDIAKCTHDNYLSEGPIEPHVPPYTTPHVIYQASKPAKYIIKLLNEQESLILSPRTERSRSMSKDTPHVGIKYISKHQICQKTFRGIMPPIFAN